MDDTSQPAPHHRWRRWLRRGLIGLVALFALIQLVPYGHAWNNPPVTKAAQWPDARSAALAKTSCLDCHSNMTNWWWGTKVAPASWLAENDVSGGRKHLNFSEWDTPQPDVDEVVEAITSGGMPPLQYRVVHPGAGLSTADRDALAAAIRTMYATDPPAGIRSRRDGD